MNSSPYIVKNARPGIMLLGLAVFIAVACINAPENGAVATKGDELKTKIPVKHHFDVSKKTSYALKADKK